MPFKGSFLHSWLTRKLLTPKKRFINVTITLAGISMVVLYSLCAEACRILEGHILGIDLTYIGFLYAGALVGLSLLRLDAPFLCLLSLGIGAELFLVAYQVLHGQYCYFCMSFAAGVTLLFILNFRAAQHAFGKTLLGSITCAGLIVLLVLFKGGADGLLDEKDAFLPSFGDGPVELRLYTDYHCEQCALLEERMQPVIADLVRQGRVRVAFINTSSESLYSKYYLYALRSKNDLERALLVRALLFTAQSKGIQSRTEIERLFKDNGIAFQEFDVRPTLRLVMRRIEDDRVSSTPTCVIRNGARRTLHVGTANIMTALTDLR